MKFLWLTFFSSDDIQDVISFPDTYFTRHQRYAAIQLFKNFLENQCTCLDKQKIYQHSCLLRNVKKTPNVDELNAELDLSFISSTFPYDDFISTLTCDPQEVIGCLNMAVSVLLWEFIKTSPNAPLQPLPIYVRLYNLPSRYALYSELKANSCGRLVGIRGHVIRVSACNPLIASGNFRCTKCSGQTTKYFADGIFSPVSFPQVMQTSFRLILCYCSPTACYVWRKELSIKIPRIYTRKCTIP